MGVCERHTLVRLQRGLLVAVLLVERNGWSTGMFMKLRYSPLVLVILRIGKLLFVKFFVLLL